MSSQRLRDGLKDNIGLLLAGLGIALTVWFGVRANEPNSRFPIVGSRIGYAGYVAGSVFVAFATAVMIVAWSRRFWPRVRFEALYGEIAKCRDGASNIRAAVHSNTAEFVYLEDMQYVVGFLHRMDELRAALRPLGIDLSMSEPDREGSARLHADLRALAAAAHVGNIRGARAMFEPKES